MKAYPISAAAAELDAAVDEHTAAQEELHRARADYTREADTRTAKQQRVAIARATRLDGRAAARLQEALDTAAGEDPIALARYYRLGAAPAPTEPA